jgi:hypothetical protein
MVVRGGRVAARLVVLFCANGVLAACRPGVPVGDGSSPAPSLGASVQAQSGAAQPARCERAGLVLSAGMTDAGSGHRSVALVFTNRGAQPCRLHGYPGVAALDANGNQVAQARRTPNGYLGGLATGQQLPTVTLATGQSASALVEALAFSPADGSACAAYQGLLVTAPDDTESTGLPWRTDGCTDLQIHPIVPGSDGRAG